MTTTIIILAVALALVGAGVGALVFFLVKLPGSLVGSIVAALLRPIKKLFKGGKGDGEAKPSKAGVADVGVAQAAAAAA